MCIGIVSEHGVPMPDDVTLKRCWDGNSDGAGYAYLREDAKWQVKKGFMNWASFKDSFDDEKFTDDNTVVIHFRIGTSGRCPSKQGEWGKGEFCTHPFPISDDLDELESLEYTADQIVIHNGVVGVGAGFLSDTMVAIRDQVSVLWKYAVDDAKVMDLLTEMMDCGPRYKGSRWFIGDGNNYELLGGWDIDPDTKIWYTHTGYQPVAVYAGYGAYGYDNYENNGWTSALDDEDDTASSLNSGLNASSLVHILPGQEAHKFMESSSWSWKKWNERGSSIEQVLDETLKKDDRVREVYDSAGNNIIALVDAYGNVVWDDAIDDIPSIPDQYTDEDLLDTFGAPLGEEPFECVNCAANDLTFKDLDEGHCPYCSVVLVPSLAIKVENTAPCPNCQEKQHLAESTFDIGDTECFRCGAVFVNTIRGEDSILTWNEDTKAAHEDLIQSALKDK